MWVLLGVGFLMMVLCLSLRFWKWLVKEFEGVFVWEWKVVDMWLIVRDMRGGDWGCEVLWY